MDYTRYYVNFALNCLAWTFVFFFRPTDTDSSLVWSSVGQVGGLCYTHFTQYGWTGPFEVRFW